MTAAISKDRYTFRKGIGVFFNNDRSIYCKCYDFWIRFALLGIRK